MFKRNFLLAAVAALALVFAGCVAENGEDDKELVRMVGSGADGFDRPALTITAGTTVVWHNTDNAPHTATANDGSWDSGVVNSGDRWEYTFDEPGTYDYHCVPHASVNDDGECSGMCATIIVEPVEEA